MLLSAAVTLTGHYISLLSQRETEHQEAAWELSGGFCTTPIASMTHVAPCGKTKLLPIINSIQTHKVTEAVSVDQTSLY